MGNSSPRVKAVESESDEEYCVLNISNENLLKFRNLIKADNLEEFQQHLQETKTVDTDAYLEFTDALIAEEDGAIYTLKGKRDAPPGMDPFEALIESGYVISMLEHAQERKSKKITKWLADMIEYEKFTVDLSANPIPDFNSLIPKNWEGVSDFSYVENDSPDVLRLPADKLEQYLQNGQCPLWFTGINGECNSRLKAKIKNLINLTGFEDETKENGVPYIDCDDPQEWKKYTFIYQTNIRMMCTKDINLVTPEEMASFELNTKVHCFKHANERPKVLRAGEDGWQPRNNRTSRTVAPGILGMKITVQLQFSEMNIDEINSNQILSEGITWTRAILSERTKQNITRKDTTAKMKTLALMKQLDGGVLLHVIGVTANTMTPAYVINLGKKKAIEKAILNMQGIGSYWREKDANGRKPEAGTA